MAPPREDKTESRQRFQTRGNTPRNGSDKRQGQREGQPTRLARRPPDPAPSPKRRRRPPSPARQPARSPTKVSGGGKRATGKQSLPPPRSRSAAAIPKRQSRQSKGSANSSRRKTHRRFLAKHLSHFKDIGLLFKKGVRNLILYPVAIVCLYPMIVFRHNIYLMVLYLYIWTNIVLAVAIFLDELFDLPRKH